MFSRVRLFSAAGVTVALLLAVVFAGLQLPSGASAASSVDVTANVVVPNQADAGSQFMITGEVGNIGADAADGATFRVEFAPGTTDLAATCASVDSGAVCPASFNITQATSTDKGVVEGVIPTLPPYGVVHLEFTGKFTSLSSTSETVMLVAAPAGAVDVDPVSDRSVQNTVLNQPSTTVKVTKTQDKVLVDSGETRTYTVTYENTGNADTRLALSDAYNGSVGWRMDVNVPGVGQIQTGYLQTTVGSSVSWSVSCHPSSTVACPAGFDGHQATFDSGVMSRQLYGTNSNNPDMYQSLGLRDVLLPAGKKLVLTIPVTETLGSCVGGSEYVGVQNMAYSRYAGGVSWQSGVVVLNSDDIRGAVRCADVSSITRVSDTQPVFGAPLTITSRVTNAVGFVEGVPITQVLPAGGVLSKTEAESVGLANSTVPAFQFVCKRGQGANDPGTVVTCPTDLAYDAATHTVKTNYQERLNADQWFEVATTAFAGFVPATTASYDIRTELGHVAGDINTHLNNSSVTVRYRNDQVKVTSEHTLNIPAPQAITVTGVLTCQQQGDPAANPPGKVAEFTAVIPEGATSVTVPVMQGLWKHDTCKVTVTRGAPPAGYYWSDADEWPVSSVANRSNVDTDWHVVFPMRLAVVPVPVIPLTGGVSGEVYGVFGGLVLLVAVGFVLWRRHHQTT